MSFQFGQIPSNNAFRVPANNAFRTAETQPQATGNMMLTPAAREVIDTFRNSTYTVPQFFEEMRYTLCKDSPNAKLSESDLDRYAQILQSSRSMLEDTINFSASGEFSTDAFQEQLEELDKRQTLVNAIGRFFNENRDAIASGGLFGAFGA